MQAPAHTVGLNLWDSVKIEMKCKQSATNRKSNSQEKYSNILNMLLLVYHLLRHFIIFIHQYFFIFYHYLINRHAISCLSRPGRYNTSTGRSSNLSKCFCWYMWVINVHLWEFLPGASTDSRIAEADRRVLSDDLSNAYQMCIHIKTVTTWSIDKCCQLYLQLKYWTLNLQTALYLTFHSISM